MKLFYPETIYHRLKVYFHIIDFYVHFPDFLFQSFVLGARVIEFVFQALNLYLLSY